MTTMIPEKQHAVQLVGPDQLQLNNAKPVPQPGPYEILMKVEAVGLCFSDLKLLKQFGEHPRKSEVVAGLDPAELEKIPSYVPGDKPTVPGHEVVARIIAIGEKVKQHQVGERVLVQADWRDQKTAGSNGAFGYNFEGGLQEYTVVDERIVIDQNGERLLLPVNDERGASAVALVEPWACVEDSYVTKERNRIKAGGRLAIVFDGDREMKGVAESFSPDGPPEVICVVGNRAQVASVEALGIKTIVAATIRDMLNENYDDIVYFGCEKLKLELLNDKLATKGTMNIVLAGQKIGTKVNIGVGRVHYGYTRWIGTTGDDASASYASVPETGEIRTNDRILVIGAGGPMGQMHVIRNICSGVSGISVIGTDFDDARLESLAKKADPMAAANDVKLELVNTQTKKITPPFSYIALMAPVPALVESSIADASEGAIINIFAGIPAPVKHDIDLDTYIEKKLYMFGTSGSVIEDMKIVLSKVESGQLNTNASVDAISGMAGAVDGIKAVENRTMAGKIIVYPMLHDLGLTPLKDLAEVLPSVAAKLDDGCWTAEAEAELLASVNAG